MSGSRSTPSRSCGPPDESRFDGGDGYARYDLGLQWPGPVRPSQVSSLLEMGLSGPVDNQLASRVFKKVASQKAYRFLEFPALRPFPRRPVDEDPMREFDLV